MSRMYNVAIAGATGAVGVELIKTLERRKFPVGTLRLLASSRSVGRTMTFKGAEIVVEELTHDSFTDIDIALFSAIESTNFEETLSDLVTAKRVAAPPNDDGPPPAKLSP